MAGMFSIALDSFSDSQNFFHVFKSLLVLDFCACKNFSIATSSLLVASSAGSNLPTLIHSIYHLVLLTGTSQFFLFLFVCLFVNLCSRTNAKTRMKIAKIGLDAGLDGKI